MTDDRMTISGLAWIMAVVWVSLLMWYGILSVLRWAL